MGSQIYGTAAVSPYGALVRKCYEIETTGKCGNPYASGSGGCGYNPKGAKMIVYANNKSPGPSSLSDSGWGQKRYSNGYAHFDICWKDSKVSWDNPMLKWREVTCPSAITSKGFPVTGR